MAALLGLFEAGRPVDGAEVHHFVFFNRDRERIRDPAFLANAGFEGAQLKYAWRELEPEPGVYVFESLERDLQFLASKGKGLFVQLQDASFDEAIVNVPGYLRTDERYGGGADRQYEIPEDDESRARPAGWVARRWDPAVRARFHALLRQLGKRFDGRLEGLNLPETAVDFGTTGRLFPRGFTPAIYRESVVSNLAALKEAFPKSITLQYANFMPGEWIPSDDHGYLRAVYENARRLKVGVGGPDLLPFRPAQRAHSYPLIREASGTVPTAIAVQWGNYEARNPKTGLTITVQELFKFASEELKVGFIFWSTQEPYFTRDVVPFVRKRDHL